MTDTKKQLGKADICKLYLPNECSNESEEARKKPNLQSHLLSPKNWQGIKLSAEYCDPRRMVLLAIQVGETEAGAEKWKYLSDSAKALPEISVQF